MPVLMEWDCGLDTMEPTGTPGDQLYEGLWFSWQTFVRTPEDVVVMKLHTWTTPLEVTGTKKYHTHTIPLLEVKNGEVQKKDVMRTWTDRNGKTLEAKFVGEIIILQKKDGTEIKVPTSKLSDADQKWLRQADEPSPRPIPGGRPFRRHGEKPAYRENCITLEGIGGWELLAVVQILNQQYVPHPSPAVVAIADWGYATDNDGVQSKSGSPVI